jgi:mannitol-specific phosphotransferase system IIBC component
MHGRRKKYMGKLIVVACGAGINTSTIAEDSIRERMAQEGFADVEVKRILMADIEGYLTRDRPCHDRFDDEDLPHI